MPPRPSRWFWVATVAVVAVWALMFTQYRVFEDIASGDTGTLGKRFADELAGAGVALAFLPAPGAERMRVPLLLLQPLVENVVRHGMAAGRLEVDLRAALDGDVLLEVLDNGAGASATAGHGVGLGTTAERLRLLHGDAAELVARDRPEGGFAVRVRLPARGVG